MTIEQLINKATTFKKLAQAARQAGNYRQATTLIKRAIEILETAKPRLQAVKKGAVSAENRALAEALADVYGSSGGIYRSGGQYARSVKAYDEGERIEQDERFGFVNSYNLTQRLVARVLLDPNGWIEPKRVIADEEFGKALTDAIRTVTSQTIGPRASDVWAWADLGVLRVLSGDEKGANVAWQMLVKLTRQPFVFESTLRVIIDLLERIKPFAAKKGADPRLAAAAESLQQARDALTKSVK